MSSNEKEYFERLKIAERITGGDVEKAKKMLSGEYRNVYVIKGKFNSEKNLYGVFIVFLCEIENKILKQKVIVGSTPSLCEKSPSSDWPNFIYGESRN